MKNKNIVEYVAELDRIEVSEDQKRFLGNQLNDILSYIDKLKEVDIENIEPLRGLHTEINITRLDEVKISSCREAILKNAPLFQDNSFKIPKVIE